MAPSRSSADVVVVGGGAIGCAVAYHLAREGLSLALFERGEIAGQASGAAAGMLAPLVEAEGPGPFLRRGLESLERLPALCAELAERSGVDPEYRPSGILRVAEDAAEERELRGRAELLAGLSGQDGLAGLSGLDTLGLSWLGPEDLRALEPQVRPGTRGALHSSREAHVRSARLTRAYAVAARQLGARIAEGVPALDLLREGDRVSGVVTAEGPCAAARVVLCTGSWTRASGAWLGESLHLPVAPVRGQIVNLDGPRPPFGAIVWGRGAYLVPKADGSVVVGATVEDVGFDRRVTAEGVRSLLEAGTRLVPALADSSFLGAWAGLRPRTPDELPLVGPLPGVEGLVLAAGHYRNGVLLSPVTGELVRDGILGKGWGEPAFLPERFLGPRSGA